MTWSPLGKLELEKRLIGEADLSGTVTLGELLYTHMLQFLAIITVDHLYLAGPGILLEKVSAAVISLVVEGYLLGVEEALVAAMEN